MPPTTAISPGSVVVVRFPFAGGAASKARPAVVVSTSAFHSGLKAAIATVRSADVAATIGRLSPRDEQKLRKLLADMLAFV